MSRLSMIDGKFRLWRTDWQARLQPPIVSRAVIGGSLQYVRSNPAYDDGCGLFYVNTFEAFSFGLVNAWELAGLTDRFGPFPPIVGRVRPIDSYGPEFTRHHTAAEKLYWQGQIYHARGLQIEKLFILSHPGSDPRANLEKFATLLSSNYACPVQRLPIADSKHTSFSEIHGLVK
ncbi:hypothetical protein [Gordonia sp. MP11Mi]|uniref:Uncharacterized protein n=1 Tax=Gordonia sp. MP11Mi TaxID=3022769 RepID=A0AA97CWN2_9ACTN